MEDELDDLEETTEELLSNPREVWRIFGDFWNEDEFLDELALAACENRHAKFAYELLRRATDDLIEPLEARLSIIDARQPRRA